MKKQSSDDMSLLEQQEISAEDCLCVILLQRKRALPQLYRIPLQYPWQASRKGCIVPFQYE